MTNRSLPILAAAASFLWTYTLVCAETDGRLGPTLTDDVKAIKVDLVEGYSKARPRLLFGADDKAALQAKAKSCPELWPRVIASAKRLGSEAPDENEIKTGAHYWRIERVHSGALAYFVTGDKAHRDAAIRWMVPYCKEPVWGVGWGSNVDLHAAWYLYHISMAYDILYDELSEADRKTVRDGLADHARAIYASLNPADPKFRYKSGVRYDQNHTYIPTVGLLTTSLALAGEVPEAMTWLKHACAVMRRCRAALGDDGWYYEGTGYWAYAMHWHVRYAELIARATGENPYDLPILKHNWLFPLHTGLHGSPGRFDIGDVAGGFRGGKRSEIGRTNNHSMFWRLAAALKSPESQMVGNALDAKAPDNDYPGVAFLRYDPSLKPAKLADVKPYYYFKDHGFVCWRSGWGKGDTVLAFRCGPPAGHATAAKLGQMKDWVMNCGHTHPDIGSFWLYAKGAYLATDTGYTAKKYTRDHNTLTIGDVGQGVDGTYHNERGYPYERFNQCRIDKIEMDEKGVLVSGEFGAAYPKDKVGDVTLRRTLKATKNVLVVVDEMTSDKPHKLTWYCHADAEFKPEGDAFVARLPDAGLAVIPVDHAKMASHCEKTIVAAGTGPGEGKPEHRGWHLKRYPAGAIGGLRMVHVLVPLDKDAKPPTVKQKDTEPDGIVLLVTWPDGKTESVQMKLGAKSTPPPPDRSEWRSNR